MYMRQVHHGSVLKDELAEPGVRTAEHARQAEVPANRVSQIIACKRSITGDTALRFGHRIGAEAQFSLNLQGRRDLARASQGTGNAIRRLPARHGVSSGGGTLVSLQCSRHQRGLSCRRLMHLDARVCLRWLRTGA